MLQPLSNWPADHDDGPEPTDDSTDDYNEIGEQSLSAADRNPLLR